MIAPEYEEVRADEVRVGDYATRARTRAFWLVLRREPVPGTRYTGADRVELTLKTGEGEFTSRPKAASTWWRQTNQPRPEEKHAMTTAINPATKLPHTSTFLARTNVAAMLITADATLKDAKAAPTRGDRRRARKTHTWTMVGPFRATDTRVEPSGDLLPGWEIVDSEGRIASTAPSRDKARARARELNAGGETVTRQVLA